MLTSAAEAYRRGAQIVHVNPFIDWLPLVSKRGVRGYRAIPYDLPRGCAIGYMPELNALCPIGDYSARATSR